MGLATWQKGIMVLAAIKSKYGGQGWQGWQGGRNT